MPDLNQRRDRGRISALLQITTFWTVAALLASWPLLAGGFLPSPHHGWRSPLGDLPGCDFANIWVGARLMLKGQADRLSDLGKYILATREYLGPGYMARNWSYPPVALFLVAPFGLPPYLWSLALWSLAGIAAFLAVLRCGARPLPWTTVAAVTLLSPAAILNLVDGQNGFFTAALFLGGFCLLERREKTAGVLFGLLCFKPHLGLLIPPALFILKRWKAFLAAAATVAVLAAASVALWGLEPWRLYFANTLPYLTYLLTRAWRTGAGRTAIYPLLMPGAYADARMSALEPMAAAAFHLLAASAGAAAAFFILWREKLTPRAVLALAIAAILVTPYGFGYDMMAATGALAVYACSGKTGALPFALALGPLWALPLLIVPIRLLHLPLGAAVMLAALAWLALESRRERLAA